ncbi:MAG: hypothetical protein EZS28_012781 [Streblomastix strix]|uniref:RRM domain-containing protein n=1 Tax=Streblomastix strix TaxID=222440 RepID=A0A5J4W9U7_9EUKA|nr:MAG: hypothetical protein EZS28_012781 [Streblomastix strix]
MQKLLNICLRQLERISVKITSKNGKSLGYGFIEMADVESAQRAHLQVRSKSRDCFYWVHLCGDASDQSELVSVGYVGMCAITCSTAGGQSEEQDWEIYWGLFRISQFLKKLHLGRNYAGQPSFQPLPVLVQRSQEQIEEEGGNEEVDSQQINIEYCLRIWNTK